MAFSKKRALEANFNAIKEVFDKARERREVNKEVLENYVGFGGIKEFLLDPYSDQDWTDNNKSLRPLVKKIYDEINDFYVNKGTPESIDKMINSLKNSSLTTFYTDKELIKASLSPLKKLLPDNNLSILDPSTGAGAYIAAAKEIYPTAEIIGVEKEGFVATLSKLLHEVPVYPSGLEKTNEFLAPDSFDLVTSNIPFGNIKVYDSRLAQQKNAVLNESMGSIHNYFFTKSIELAKENGVIAFITSTGVMDAEANKNIREYLVQNAQLVGAYRLPDFVFNEVGTSVGSDLIVLKKREHVVELDDPSVSLDEKMFISADGELDNHPINKYFQHKTQNVFGGFNEVFLHNRKSFVIGENTIFKQNSDVIRAVEKNLNRDVDKFLYRNLIQDAPLDLVEVMEREGLTHHDLKIVNRHQYDILKTHFNESASKDKVQLEFVLGDNIYARVSLKSLSVEKSTEKISVETKEQLDLFSEVFSEPVVKKDPSRIYDRSRKEEYIALTPEEIDGLNIGELFNKDGINGVIARDLVNKLFLDTEAVERYDFKDGLVDAYNEVKRSYNRLIDAETNQDLLTADKERLVLNSVYDSFVERFGQLNDENNSFLLGIDSSFSKLLSLENLTGVGYVKCDLFSKSTFITEKVAQIDSFEDALFYSLNFKGCVDLEVMAEKLSVSVSDVILEGTKKELLFPNPVFAEDFNFISPKGRDYRDSVDFVWDTKDVFLSGAVKYKIEALERADKFDFKERNIGLLNSVKPEELTIDVINPSLGEMWIDDVVYSDFAKSYFNTPSANVSRIGSLNDWMVDNSGIPYYLESELTVQCKSGRRKKSKDIFLHALKKESVVIHYKDDNEVKRLDRDAMEAVNRTIDDLNEKFKEFVFSHPSYSVELANKYNALFNRDVFRKFDGSHLKIPGLNEKEITPYKHQLDAVWQLTQNNGGLCDHIVGAGKTLVIAMAAQEMKRMGVINKPMVLCLKANVNSIYNDYMKAFPNAKVLKPKDSDFTPAKRKEFFYRVAANDWDCVILTHDQFAKIPQSLEIERSILEEELEFLEKDLNLLYEDSEFKPSKTQLAGLEKRKANLEANLEKVYDSLKRDEDVISFEKMGIDKLFVDESHYFKNLGFTTRHNRLAGLGTMAGSIKAQNLLTACRTLQDMHGGDKGVTFLTGTSISNSLVELYSLFRYLAPSKLAERSIENFDSWAAVFTESSQDLELSVTNEIKPKMRLRTFVKVPELVSMYRGLANVVNENNFTIKRPDIENVFVTIDATKEQEQFSEGLIQAVKSNDFSFVGKNYTESQIQAKMLLATNLSAKAALDMRLVDSDSYDGHSGSKIYALAHRSFDEYEQSMDYLGTQLIFCDLGTPKDKKEEEYSYSLYESIRSELINKGVPENEIKFIHEINNDKKKKQLEKDFNDGKVRFLIGSTTKMGVGWNLQKRIVAMHHLDCPWRPSDLEQRVGRGRRQGNWAADSFKAGVVKNYFYATEKSLDAYKYALVEMKRKFINQIKDGSVVKRVIKESDDESLGMVDFIAQVSGNKDILELAKLEKKIEELKMKSSALKNQVRAAHGVINNGNDKLQKKKKLGVSLEEDLVSRDKYFKISEVINDKGELEKGDEGIKVKLSFEMAIGDGVYTDQKEIGEKLLDALDSKLDVLQWGESAVLGSVGDFRLKVRKFEFEDSPQAGIFDTNYEVFVDRAGSNNPIKYVHGSKQLSSVPGVAARYIYECLQKIDNLIKKNSSELELLAAEMIGAENKIKNIDATKFDAQLEDALEKQKELKARIDLEQDPLEDAVLAKDEKSNDKAQKQEKKSSSIGL